MSDTHPRKKPRSSIPFLPDPSKWIQTTPSSSSSSSSKKAGQRPLVGFRNAFVTPPTTVRARPGGELPLTAGPSRQKSLNGFLTPPPTRRPEPVTGGSRIEASRNGRPLKAAGRSKLAVRADNPSSDSDSDNVQVRNARPLQSHRSAPVTSSSSGMSDAIDQPLPHTPRPRPHRRKRHRTLTSSPSPPLPEPSSDRPITPVPEYVLDIHRRLCGRDTQRMKDVRSPWHLGVGSELSLKDRVASSTKHNKRSPVRPEGKADKQARKTKQDVDERAHDQALVRRRQRQEQRHRPEKENEGKRLVGSSQLGSERSTPKKRKVDDLGAVLSPRRVNAADHAVMTDADPLAVYQAFRAPSPRVRTPRKLRRLPNGTSPNSAIPLGSPTPTKHHPAQDNTAPSRHASRSNAPRSTAPASSDPPRSSPNRSIGFKPVSMQPETLMTWSLGPQPQPRPRAQQTVEVTPRRPDVQPVQASTPVKADSTETQSLAPSNTSQSFPNLLPSPSRPAPSKPSATSRPSVVFPETVLPSVSKRGSGLLGQKRSLARFPTDFGVPETVLPSRSSSPTKPAKRPRGSTRESPRATQSHLAQFGFFKDRPRQTVRGFDSEWDDEEDIPLEPLDAGDGVKYESGQSQGSPSRLQPVPQPPPHPHLRPAGLRELKRRQDRDEVRDPPTPLPASSSQPDIRVNTDRSSSFTTTDDDLPGGGVMNASVAAWWEGLEDRRSSEFGSIL